MAHDPLVCPECHETVPPGRLSCPHCGTVLAAVAGRAWARPVVATDPGDEPALVARSVADVLADGAASVTAASAAIPPVLRDPGELPQPGLFDHGDDDLEADAPLPVAHGPTVWEPARLPPPPLLPTQDQLPPVTPSYLPRPGLRPTSAPAGLPDADVDVPEDPTPAPPPPGAWVPPAPVAPDASMSGIAVPGAPNGAAAAGGVGSVVAVPPAPFLARAWEGTAPAPSPDGEADGAPTVGDRARRLLTLEGVTDAANAVVLAGSMAVAISFLVPWSRVMIGARSSGSYTDSWGLAGPGHAWVFLAAIVTCALAAMPNRVSAWFRSGVLGLILGSLVLGLAWPYALGPLGAGPGVVLVVVAGFMLVGAGLTGVATSRHRAEPPAV